TYIELDAIHWRHWFPRHCPATCLNLVLERDSHSGDMHVKLHVERRTKDLQPVNDELARLERERLLNAYKLRTFPLTVNGPADSAFLDKFVDPLYPAVVQRRRLIFVGAGSTFQVGIPP